ncbi:MAG: tetratricopeptide repeat protein [Nitrospirae bacterium]|nr:tetratricopeptide repeat protein [Nitrospirota bacterium]
MGKIFAVLLILFLGFIAYLGFLNQNEVAIKLSKSHLYEIPMVIFILISSLSGAFFMFILYTIRDTKRLIRNIKAQKKQKQQEKLQSLYNEALTALYSGRRELARKKLEELLGLEPSHISGLMKMAEIYLDEKNYKEALEYYRKIVSFEPDHIGSKLKMAEIYLIQEQYDDALRYLEEVLKVDPLNRAAIMKKRKILEIQERWGELIELQKDILKRTSDSEEKNREEKRLLGYTYEEAKRLLDAGELDRAKKMFKSILKSQNNFIPAHIGIARVFINKSHQKDAIDYLEKTFEETGSLIVLANLEEIILGQEDPSRIISIYKKALAQSPEDNTLRYFLIKLYYRLEMLDDALELIESIDNQKLYPQLDKIRGAIAIKRGHFEEAARIFRGIVDMKRALKLPLCCSECAALSDDWHGRCPACGSWNSLDFNIHGICEATRKVHD